MRVASVWNRSPIRRLGITYMAMESEKTNTMPVTTPGSVSGSVIEDGVEPARVDGFEPADVDRNVRLGLVPGHHPSRGASMMLTCAATTRQPSGKRTHVCICRPTLPARAGRWNSVEATA